MTKQFKQEQMINYGFRNFREEENTVFGQPASSKMLLSHLLILSLVGVTINGQACPATSKAGETSKAGVTSKAGATTTKAGATTTKAGATTTKAAATTTKAGATTTKAGATTTKAGATTTKAGATTTKAEATTTNYNGACSSMSIIDGSLTDCTAIYTAGCEKSGIYKITPNGWTEDPFEAYCDMETTVPNLNSCDGHGWTVFQRRVNGSVDFNRNWTSYKEGFGQLDHEFWLGNEKLHYLTQHGKNRLRIDLVSNSGRSYHACYKEFHIKEEGEMYELHASRFFGTKNLMDGLEDKIFRTSDEDNDNSGGQNCAATQGGWWYHKCKGSHTNLNGVYGSTSIHWKGLPEGESITFSEMKIQSCLCNCDDEDEDEG